MMKTQNYPLGLRIPIFFVTFVGFVSASDSQGSAFEWVSTVSFHIPSDTIQNRKLCPQYHSVWTQYVINNSIQNCCGNTLPPKKIECWFRYFFFLWRCGPTRAMSPSFLRFIHHTHNDASQSVVLLWASDQLVTEASTWQHTTLTTGKHPCPRWDRTHDLSRGAAADLRLRPRGHWDRLVPPLSYII